MTLSSITFTKYRFLHSGTVTLGEKYFLFWIWGNTFFGTPGTTLSANFWAELEAGRAPSVTWRVLESNIPSFNPVTGKCQLCIREKFYIVHRPHLATLNQRQEIFSNCRHKESRLLRKAPD